MNNSNKQILTLLGILAAFIMLAVFGQMVTKEIDKLTEAPPPAIPFTQTADIKKEVASGASGTAPISALRVERRPPQEEYSESVILVDKKEVARFKTKDGEMFDVTGQIPGGKIKFVNEEEDTYGFEYYREGERDGEYTEYYNNDKLKTEATYRRGRLIYRTVYFRNGTLYMQEDYSSASRFLGLRLFKGLKEAGTGKIYQPDGSLRYEWSFLDDSEKNFNKTYDNKGNLLDAHYYNSQGDLLEHWEAP